MDYTMEDMKNLVAFLKNEYLFEVGNGIKPKHGTLNVLITREGFIRVECVKTDEKMVRSAVKQTELNGIDVTVVQRKRLEVGDGFGKGCWRENTRHNGIELSFGERPSSEVLSKIRGVFKWSQRGGIWYARKCPATERIAVELNLTKVESV